METQITINSGIVAGYVLAAATAFIMPFAVWFVHRKKTGAAYYPLVAGIIAFNVISVCRAVARLILISGRGSYGDYFLMALTAGVFEEGGRYILFKKFMQGHDGIDSAVSAGIGHGGFEILMVSGFHGIAVSNLTMAAAYRSGGLQTFAESGCDIDETVMLLEKIADGSFASGLFLAGSDILALCFHIAMSVLVFIAAKYAADKTLLFAAAGIHILIDFIAAFKFNGAISEGGEFFFKLIFTAAACYFTYRVYLQNKSQEI